jgi:hypothetical protein
MASPRDRLATIVIFTAVVEIGTALLLLVNPEFVLTLLLGTAADVPAQVVGQCFGIALLALAVAWWPDQASAEGARSSFRGALTYNGLIALFLAYLGTARHMGGVLLWPAMALHAVVSFLLIATWRARRREKPAASTSTKISG